MAGRNSKDDEAAIGCVVYLLLIIFLMPLAGIYFLSKPDPNAKLGGAVLLVVGLVLWILIATSS